jgi:hypothetical protein
VNFKLNMSNFGYSESVFPRITYSSPLPPGLYFKDDTGASNIHLIDLKECNNELMNFMICNVGC